MTEKTVAYVVDVLKRELEEKKYIDVGVGAEGLLGVTREVLGEAMVTLVNSGLATVTYVTVTHVSKEVTARLHILAEGSKSFEEVQSNIANVKPMSVVPDE